MALSTCFLFAYLDPQNPKVQERSWTAAPAGSSLRAVITKAVRSDGEGGDLLPQCVLKPSFVLVCWFRYPEINTLEGLGDDLTASVHPATK